MGIPSIIPKIPKSPPPRTIPSIINSGLSPTLSPIIFGDMNHPSILLIIEINITNSKDFIGLKNSVIIITQVVYKPSVIFYYTGFVLHVVMR